MTGMSSGARNPLASPEGSGAIRCRVEVGAQPPSLTWHMLLTASTITSTKGPGRNGVSVTADCTTLVTTEPLRDTPTAIILVGPLSGVRLNVNKLVSSARSFTCYVASSRKRGVLQPAAHCVVVARVPLPMVGDLEPSTVWITCSAWLPVPLNVRANAERWSGSANTVCWQ